jgi:RNA polymerase sigma-70 factor, ECF subfamily
VGTRQRASSRIISTAFVAMPPQPGLFVGARKIVDSWYEAFDTETFGHVRGVITGANMQPALACYRRRPGESDYKPMALDVLGIEDGAIAEIVTFPAQLFKAFGLPAELRVT